MTARQKKPYRWSMACRSSERSVHHGRRLKPTPARLAPPARPRGKLSRLHLARRSRRSSAKTSCCLASAAAEKASCSGQGTGRTPACLSGAETGRTSNVNRAAWALRTPESTRISWREIVSSPTEGRHGAWASAAVKRRSSGGEVSRGSPAKTTACSIRAVSNNSGSLASSSGPARPHARATGPTSASRSSSVRGGSRQAAPRESTAEASEPLCCTPVSCAPCPDPARDASARVSMRWSSSAAPGSSVIVGLGPDEGNRHSCGHRPASCRAPLSSAILPRVATAPSGRASRPKGHGRRGASEMRHGRKSTGAAGRIGAWDGPCTRGCTTGCSVGSPEAGLPTHKALPESATAGTADSKSGAREAGPMTPSSLRTTSAWSAPASTGSLSPAAGARVRARWRDLPATNTAEASGSSSSGIAAAGRRANVDSHAASGSSSAGAAPVRYTNSSPGASRS
eukprot:scaffold1021_cov108-Isochrysis_galbana.AAC.15